MRVERVPDANLDDPRTPGSQDLDPAREPTTDDGQVRLTEDRAVGGDRDAQPSRRGYAARRAGTRDASGYRNDSGEDDLSWRRQQDDDPPAHRRGLFRRRSHS